MKPAKFEYIKPSDLAETMSALAAGDGFNIVLAGSQSLGPMMNFRLARPDRLIDIRELDALKQVTLADDHLFIGALVTHAKIEDGALPDVTKGMMVHVASGIAYRAVRNRGTIGGSIAHADPAGDWPAALLTLGAEVVIDGPNGARELALTEFQIDAFTVALEAGEVLRGFRVPILSDVARWGYHKISRRPGDFADSIGAFVCDSQSGVARLVLGATDGAPLQLNAIAATIAETNGAGFDIEAARSALAETEETFEPFKARIHALALQRAVADAYHT
jgi:carbon-monoxide dehydrogenase medium subunit